MNDQQAYELVLAQARAMEADQIRMPNMPVNVFIHEALRLHDWADEDREALEGAGMPWLVCEELPIRSAALRHAESLWTNERYIKGEARKKWTAESEKTYDLRDTLVHTYRFAFRQHPELKQMVDRIARGRSHADMLQDLRDLVVAGRRNQELLAAIKFDPSELERCEILAEELGTVYADARNDRQAFHQARQVRDKIFTLLKQSVDEVRAFGQYLFWRDSERRSGYASEYIRNRDRQYQASSARKTAAEQPPQPGS